MGAQNDQSISYSRLTQEEVEAVCLKWGIDSKFNLKTPGMDKSIDQCPAGSIALYCRHFEFSNLRRPFSVFVLNVLEYYHVSFGQLHPRASLGFYTLRLCVGLRGMIRVCYPFSVSSVLLRIVIGLLSRRLRLTHV
ncbi:hypothetical protein Hanom_Chr15g01411451 [Helianthus anomalus]